MEKSEYYDSSIAEEEHLNATNIQLQQSSPLRNTYKLASLTQVRASERQAQIQNTKKLQEYSVYLREDMFAVPINLHFLNQQGQSWLITDDKREDASQVLQRQENNYSIKIPLSNIGRHNIMKVELGSLKKGKQMILESREEGIQEHTVGYRYTFKWHQNYFHLHVWLKLDGQFKVWKEMEVPLNQNRVVLQIQQFNNEQTDVRVNDFLFHLVLKTAYCHDSNYHLSLQGAAVLQKLQLRSFSLGKHPQDIETHCSKECKLI